MYSHIPRTISCSQRSLCLYAWASLFLNTFIPIYDFCSKCIIADGRWEEKKQLNEQHSWTTEVNWHWLQRIHLNQCRCPGSHTNERLNTLNILSTFYQKDKPFRSLICIKQHCASLSNRCMFCVTDFGDQVDSLSSNYVHPPQSVTVQPRTLPEECQKGL